MPNPNEFNNVYTGARYVPIFADPPRWSNTTYYEHLMMVLDDQMSTWISRYAVPAGTPLEEGEYWVKFFDAPATIAEQLAEIEAMKMAMTKLEQHMTEIDSEHASIKNTIKVIEQNAAALEARVTKAEADIQTNATNINTNVNNIQTNKDNIQTNKENIETNATHIEENARSILANTRLIEINQTHLAEHDTEIANLHDTDNELHDLIVTNQDSIAENADKIAANKTSIDTLNTELAKTNQNVHNNKLQIDTNTSQIADINTEITDLKATDATLNQRLNAQEQELNDTNNKVQSLNTAVTNIQTTVPQLQNQIQDLHSDIDTLNEEQTTQNDAIASLTESLTNTNTNVTNIQADIDDINKRIENVPESITSLTEQVNANTAEIQKNDTDILALQNKNTEQDTKLEAIETSQTEQDTKITALETSQAEQDTKIEALETSQSEHDTKISELETEVDSNKTILDNLSDDLSSQQTSLSGLISKVDVNTQDIDRNTKNISKLLDTIKQEDVKIFYTADYDTRKNGGDSGIAILRNTISAAEATNIPYIIVINHRQSTSYSNLTVTKCLGIIGIADAVIRFTPENTDPFGLRVQRSEQLGSQQILICGIRFEVLYELTRDLFELLEINCPYVCVENCLFTGGESGIHIVDGDHIEVTNCIFNNHTYSGININSDTGKKVSHIKISHNSVPVPILNFCAINTQMFGLIVNNNDLTITGSAVTSQRQNVTNAMRNIKILFNTIDATTGNARTIFFTGMKQFDGGACIDIIGNNIVNEDGGKCIEITDVDNLNISNNFIDGKIGMTIDILRCQHSTFTNNNVYGNDNAPTSKIRQSNTFVMTGNIFPKIHFLVDTVLHSTFSNNITTNNVQIMDSPTCVLSGNVVIE